MNRAAIAVVAGLAGGLAWIAGMLALFGPAQTILLDPALQSEKFLNVVGDTTHPARMAGNIWVFIGGLLAIGQIHSAVFSWIGGALRAGLQSAGGFRSD